MESVAEVAYGTGKLVIANDILGDFLYLLLVDERFPVTLNVSLCRSEAVHLLTMFQQACACLREARAPGIVTLGKLPPRPVVLTFSAVIDPRRNFVLLRVSQRDQVVFDCALEELATIE